MAGTVHNPSTPYVGPIQGNCHDGMKIHITGTTEHHHNGFLISLQCGGSIDPRSDCAFVFNPRFADNQVVRNSLQNGAWGNEERHGGFPFHKGHHTTVDIHVTHHAFKVSVNGRHFCDYNHRMDLHRVTHISVEQGIRVSQIRFEGARHHRGHGGGGGIGAAVGHFAGAILNEFSNTRQQHHPPPPAQNETRSMEFGFDSGFTYPGGGGGGGYPGAPIYNPPTPFVSNIGGLYPNKMIFISGIPNPNPSRFNINFDCGGTSDIAFHFDVGFNYSGDKNVIVCNTFENNLWQTERRNAPSFPFKPDSFFETIIMVAHDRFKVELPVYGWRDRFTVYIQHGNHHEPHDIALTFDARFNYGSDRNVVVRNCKQGGGWASEERHCPYFPFMPNASFEMIIMVEPHCFKVAVNNQHLLEFAHRVQPLNRCDTIRIDGDVRLTQVKFQ